MLVNTLISGVLVAFAAIISIFTLKYTNLTVPYLWLALVWVVVFLSVLKLIPQLKKLWISCAVITCMLAGLEAYAWISATWIFKSIDKDGSTFSWAIDDLLGFVAPKGVALRDTKIFKGKRVYDAIYTMDANGLRITSDQPQDSGTDRPCILFFGDSYTFGWGLNDPDTLPYRVATRVGPEYRVYNLSFETHGAHQMLAELEEGAVSKETACAPEAVKYIIFSATPDQVRRAAGLRTIDQHHGPRYVLQSDGSVVRQGQFGVSRTRAENIRAQLEKSWLYRKIVGGNAIYLRHYNSNDVKLYLAIVDSARNLSRKLYPESSFHVLAWGNDPLHRDRDGSLRDQMIDGLVKEGLSVHRVNDILPGSDDNTPEYFMGEFSLHPTSAANKRIAEYIVQDILNQ
jgi:hypothetical protein